MVAMVTNRFKDYWFSSVCAWGGEDLVLCLFNYVSNEWWSYFKYSVWEISQSENSVL